jgi:hypothetical protein
MRIGSAKKEKAMFRNFKVLMIAFVVLVLAGSGYAFAAANTVDATIAGEGAGAVTGFVITDIVYTLNATDASKIDSVAFTTDGVATIAKVNLNPLTKDSWYACVDTDGVGAVNAWTCNTTAAPTGTVALMTEITIVALNQ